MSEFEIRKDKYGFEYFDHLPKGFRVGTFDDFHIRGTKRVGMLYLIKRFDEPNHYEIHYLKEWTEGKNLQPFFMWDMIFVKETNQPKYERTGKTNTNA